MLEKIKHWFTVPPDNPGEFTEADERILEHDNQRHAQALDAEQRAQETPRCRWSFWFFFF